MEQFQNCPNPIYDNSKEGSIQIYDSKYKTPVKINSKYNFYYWS